MNTEINTLETDTIENYASIDAVDFGFLRAIKSSPLTAVNYIYEPDIHETLKQTILGAIDAKNNVLAQRMGGQLFANNTESILMFTETLKSCSLYTNVINTNAKDKFTHDNFKTLPLKCRFDGISVEKGYIIDYSITDNASPYTFQSLAEKNDYHIKAAFACFLARRLFNKSFDYYFIAQEHQRPYNSAIYKCSSAMIQKGEAELLELLSASAYMRHNTNISVSYSAFCPNESGIFDLNVNSDNINPRKFYL